MTTTHTFAAAPGRLPLLGHTLAFARDPLGFVTGLSDHADLVEIRLGPHPAYVACHPALVHEVLLHDRIFDKGGPFFDKIREATGDSVATCPAHMHRRQRRLVQPAFHHTRMRGYAQRMAREITTTTADWHHGLVLDVPAVMKRFTTAVTAGCLLSAGTDTTTFPRLHASIDAVIAGVGRRIMLPVAFLDRLPTPANRRFEHARTHLRVLTDTLITDYRSAGVDRGDLLSMLLATPDGGDPVLDDTEIHDQLVTFFIGAVETTANALSWACHLLGAHPHVQESLHAEAHAVLEERLPSHDDVPALERTGHVVTETLRLYPPGWLFTRTVATATELGGHRLPAGATVIYSPYQLHRRADLYRHPCRFDPQRWSGADPTAPATLVPFGGGARKCVGDTFAVTQITLALAAITARWRLTPVPGRPVRPAARAALAPRELHMRLHDRARG